jgi:hypothetical protein
MKTHCPSSLMKPSAESTTDAALSSIKGSEILKVSAIVCRICFAVPQLGRAGKARGGARGQEGRRGAASRRPHLPVLCAIWAIGRGANRAKG